MERLPTVRTPVEKTKEAKPDLVILDIAMPVVNGFDAAKVTKEFKHPVGMIEGLGTARQLHRFDMRESHGSVYQF